ncbi:MAG: hypothetical protein KAT70_00075 [Thermoplasmata archaeon]|nr:hypothetical protein [Thermoplasmata archaeon]
MSRFEVQLKDNETIIDAGRTPGRLLMDCVRMTRQRLTDNSFVYAILIGNVRIDCVGKGAASNLFTGLTESGQFDVEVAS